MFTMAGQPRVIQNCKLTASLPERTDPALLARLVSRVPADAGGRVNALCELTQMRA